MIKVTPKAFDEIKRINTDNKPLRIAVQGGGCSGLIYKLSFSDIADGDKVLECEGTVIVVDKKSALFIKGLILDFTDGLEGRGFEFSNPNATKTCGCGSSFST